MKDLCADVRAEYAELQRIVADLTPAQWQTRTDFYEWTLYDEIAHLFLFDELALVAVADAAGFRDRQSRIEARLERGEQISEIARQTYAGIDGPELARRWRDAFESLSGALAVLEPRTRLPWFGPDMSARSFATARLMETWAHGQDVYDALGLERAASLRLKHIAHLGVVTFQWAYRVHGLDPPAEAPKVELYAPWSEMWLWNEQSRSGEVRGPAQDFCLVVTQRRHIADTRLETTGPIAAQWMKIAQCFAGPPALGPPPGRRRVGSRAPGV